MIEITRAGLSTQQLTKRTFSLVTPSYSASASDTAQVYGRALRIQQVVSTTNTIPKRSPRQTSSMRDSGFGVAKAVRCVDLLCVLSVFFCSIVFRLWLVSGPSQGAKLFENAAATTNKRKKNTHTHTHRRHRARQHTAFETPK